MVCDAMVCDSMVSKVLSLSHFHPVLFASKSEDPSYCKDLFALVTIEAWRPLRLAVLIMKVVFHDRK